MNLHRFPRLLAYLTPGFAAFVLLACGGADASAPSAEQPAAIGIRTPHPTFTPTAVGNDPAAKVVTATAGAVAPPPTTVVQVTTPTDAPTSTPTTPPVPTDPPTTAPPAKPKLVVNSGDVNVRAGPGTTYEILKMVDRGQEYEIVGKDASGDWWQVCCVDGKTGWIVGEFADTDGLVDQVQVVAANTPNVGGPADPAPAADTATPDAPTVAPAPALGFDLAVQEQFPENKLVRIFLYVFDKEGGLEGYSLRVLKDGNELPVKATSFGGSPGLTWPVADVRQRSQNMKVEFPGVAQAGVWVVELVKDGTVVGPAATFTVTANDAKQELYVRYQKR